jgi:N-formylglutamate deformylase
MKLPFVLSIPHCSARISPELSGAIALNDREVLEQVDIGTYEIFNGMPVADVLSAHWNRIVVDLNRGPERLDAKGVVALTDYQGRSIYRQGHEPDADQVKVRLHRYYHPYHARLLQALEENPVSALIDCHSLNGVGPADAPDAGQDRADVILSNYGDEKGQPSGGLAITCPPEDMQTIADAFRQQGFSVSLNNPYRGGYIVNRYGPLLLAEGRFSIQVELNQNLYTPPGEMQPDPACIAANRERVLTAFQLIASSLPALR